MKKILSKLLIAAISIVFVVTSISCSSASFKESYEQTPVHSKSVGEGKYVYKWTYNGKPYLIIKGKDGKWYAIEEVK